MDIGKRFNAEIAAADRKTISDGIELTVRGQLRFPDGSLRTFESIRTPLLRKKGGSMGILCVFRDMTEVNAALKTSEQIGVELARKNEQYEAVSAELEKQIKPPPLESPANEEAMRAKKAAFCANALKHIAAMGAALSVEDLPLYSSYVFAIKVDASVIGATALSERAALLECAANRNDSEFIKASHPEFISALSASLAEFDTQLKASESAAEVDR
jgi:HPt (histidine-containing phosphotransfer) domain-containing protein